MKIEIQELIAQTTNSNTFSFLDISLQFYSTNSELISFLEDEVAVPLPAPQDNIVFQANCVIETRSNSPLNLSGLPDYLDEDGREITSPEFGTAKIFSGDNGVMICVKDHGSLFHDGQGNFLLTIECNELHSNSNHRLNIQPIINLLLSETLLLSRKLLIHAGGVGNGAECTIWTGESGAGKTTRILSLVGGGSDFFGDDQVILGQNEEGSWYVWPYWLPVKVKPESIDLLKGLGLLNNEEQDSDGEKIIFNDMEQRLRVKKPQPLPLNRIYVLEPGNQNIFEELDFGSAFSRISNGFLHALLPGSTVFALDLLLDLLESVSVCAVSWDRLEELDRSQFV